MHHCGAINASNNPLSLSCLRARLQAFFFMVICKMLDPKMFDEFTQRVSSLIANSPAAEVEKNVKAMMSSFFSKLDLVTREEFDTQANVLARTRQLVEQLSARLDELEAQKKTPQ